MPEEPQVSWSIIGRNDEETGWYKLNWPYTSWSPCVAPRKKEKTMSQERDTHFKGVASLIIQESEGTLNAIKLTQRLYDFACYIADHVDEYDAATLYGPHIVPYIDDFTDWHVAVPYIDDLIKEGDSTN